MIRNRWPCLVNFVSFQWGKVKVFLRMLIKLLKLLSNSCKDTLEVMPLLCHQRGKHILGLADFFSLGEKSNFGVRSIV